jgi:hypothetical protein
LGRVSVLVTLISMLGVLYAVDARADAAPSEQRATSARVVPADSPGDTDDGLQLPRPPEHFEQRHHGWLELAYAPSLAHWIEPLIKEAEAFKSEVNARLGHTGLDHVYVRLAEDADQMLQLAPAGAPYPAYAEGVAYSRLGLILLSGEPQHPAEDYDLLTTFRHELAHVALYDSIEKHSVPLWFNEGLAIHLSRENAFARSRALWGATVSDDLLPLRQLDQRFPSDVVGVPLAYAQSADVVRYLLRTQDQERFRLMIKRLARGQAFEAALNDSYGMDLYNLESAWREDVKGRFTLWPVLFSGTVLWTLAVVLVTLAWRRKRARQKQVLERWEREERIETERMRALALARAAALRALEAQHLEAQRLEAQRAEMQQLEARASMPTEPPTLDTLGQMDTLPPASLLPSVKNPRDSQPLPCVKHDGNWHTLH